MYNIYKINELINVLFIVLSCINELVKYIITKNIKCLKYGLLFIFLFNLQEDILSPIGRIEPKNKKKRASITL